MNTSELMYLKDEIGAIRHLAESVIGLTERIQNNVDGMIRDAHQAETGEQCPACGGKGERDVCFGTGRV